MLFPITIPIFWNDLDIWQDPDLWRDTERGFRMATIVKRSGLIHFLNVTPNESTPTWGQINTGHESFNTAYNAENTTRQWIGEDVGTTNVERYAPTIAATQIAHAGEPVFDFIDDLSFELAVGANAETDYLEVRVYKAPAGSLTIPARLVRVAIGIGDEGDASDAPLQRSYTINWKGTPTKGTFNPSTRAFAPAPTI